jgi:NAD-dependent DNA ligase
MGSMDKVKPGSSDLKSFFTKYTNPKCVMDKLDGTSLLLDLNIPGNPKAYTRGNGTYGQDISHKVRFITGMKCLKSWEKRGFVRGELIVPKSHWEKISHKGANARNYVSGVINKKLTEPEELKNVMFVAYEWQCYEGPSSEKSISEQLDSLNQGGFNTVRYKIYDDLSEDLLPKLLMDFRKSSDFEIDGIILQDNIYHPRNTSKNPKYAKAFKMDTMCDSAITTVQEIKWNTSKDGSLRPVVIFDEVALSGVNISRASGYNAQYIKDNKLGKGAKIKLIRSGEVIPKIVEVISSSSPDWPDCKYVWDYNKTHILITSDGDQRDMIIKQMLHFCKTLGIEFFKQGLIEKAYSKGCNSIFDIISLDVKTLLEYNIDGVKSKTATKIVSSIKDKLSKASMGDFAAATSYFSNMGKRRMNMINDAIPKWILMDTFELHSKIEALEGFSSKSADAIVLGRDPFKNFCIMCSKYGVKINSVKEKPTEKLSVKSSKLDGMVFLFTGFRDATLKNVIIQNGGIVNDSLTKKITHLIIPKNGFTNSKVEKAYNSSIPIVLKTDSMFT